MDIALEFTRNFRSLATELEPKDLYDLLHSMTQVRIPRGRTLLKSRMPVDSVYLTLSGLLEIRSDPGDGGGKIAEVGPGEWLGEVSVLSGDFRASATVIAATDALLLRLKHQALEELLSIDGELSSVILKHLVLLMSSRLATLNAALDHISKIGAVRPEKDEQSQEKARYWPEPKGGEACANTRQFLRDLPGLEIWPEADFNRLLSAVRIVLYPACHAFTVQDRFGNSVYLVVDGAVLARNRDPLTGAVTESTLSAGEWFGLSSLVNALPEHTSVSAVKSVWILSLSREDFNRISDESSAISRFFLYMLANELARRIQAVHALMRECSPAVLGSLER